MLSKDDQTLCNLAETAAGKVAQLLQSEFALLNSVQSNAGKDIKLDADRKAEELLFNMLMPVGSNILSEESGSTNFNCLDGPCWILDPLDGTFNYNRGFPAYAVSIAYWVDQQPVFGVIYDIANARCYTGQVGVGAWCNGNIIQVSTVNSRDQAVLATGFPAGRNYDGTSLQQFIKSVQNYKKIRMIGSAAISLANVASGVFDLYMEQDIWIWDVAAGIALVQAAGGTVNKTTIDTHWKLDVQAWNARFGLEDE